MADEHRSFGTDVVEQSEQIATQVDDVVVGDLARAVGPAVAPLVGDDHAVASGDERLDLVAPGVRQLGEAMAQQDGEAVTLVDHRQLDPVGRDPLGVAHPRRR